MFIVAGVKGNFFHKVMLKFNMTEDVPGMDYWAVNGWTNTLEKLGYDSDIVFFGNSITYGSSFHENFSDRKIVNLGYPGDNLSGLLARIPQVRCLKPEKVFVMAGINDIFSRDDNKFKTQYAMLIDSLMTIVPPKGIYVQSMLPVNHELKSEIDNDDIVRRNGFIREIACARECTYIDLFSLYSIDGDLPAELTRDGLHLKDKAYAKWAEEIRCYVYE